MTAKQAKQLKCRHLIDVVRFCLIVLVPMLPFSLAASGGEDGHSAKTINWFNWGGENKPFIFALINFAIVVAILVIFVRKPLRSYLSRRRDTVAHEIAEATDLRDEQKRRLEQMQRKFADLDRELEVIKQTAKQEAERERLEIIAQAKAEADRLVKVSERTLARELERIKKELEVEVGSAAIAAAEKLIQARIEEQDHVRIEAECVSLTRISEGNVR